MATSERPASLLASSRLEPRTQSSLSTVMVMAMVTVMVLVSVTVTVTTAMTMAMTTTMAMTMTMTMGMAITTEQLENCLTPAPCQTVLQPFGGTVTPGGP